MARPRKRVRLEDGLKLDVNKLVRQGFWPRGNEPLTFSTQWTSNHRGVITNAQSTIQKEGEDRASLRIVVVGKPEQRLELIAQPRHFGGKQWYFVCPVTGGKCSRRVDATRRGPLLQPSSLGEEGGLLDAVRVNLPPRPHSEGKGQIPIDWRSQPALLGLASQAQVDALTHL